MSSGCLLWVPDMTLRPGISGRLHALSDAELQSSGINWIILRPHFFMLYNFLCAVNGNTLFSYLGNGLAWHY